MFDVNKLEPKNDLEQEVLDWLKESDEPEVIYHDLEVSGCSGGLVSNLIYHEDILAFFEKHKHIINKMLADLISDLDGLSPAEIFDDWDREDPLALEKFNQNTLAWFGFEQGGRLMVNRYLENLEENEN